MRDSVGGEPDCEDAWEGAIALRVRPLTAEETTELQRRVTSRTLPARVVERAKMVWSVHAGERAPAVAGRLDVGAEVVRDWVKRFNAAGLAGLEDRPRSGCPPTYTPEQVGEVIAAALSDPRGLGLPFGSWTLSRLEAYLNEERGIAIKRSRIDEILVSEGLRWRAQEGWFGERASVSTGDDSSAAGEGVRVDPVFAQKRGPSSASTPRRRQVASW